MDRRDFIERAALASALLPIAGCSNIVGSDSDVGSGDPSESIIIIGAGAAGLGAAWALQSQGYTSIAVLEARDRIGGRVWTSRIWPSTPLDMGASWIHGTVGNPITTLARDAGLTTTATDYENLLYYGADGLALNETQVARVEQLTREIHRVIRGVSSASDPSMQAILDATFTGLTPEDQVLINHLVNTLIEHEFAADISELSSLAYVQQFGKNRCFTKRLDRRSAS